MGVPRSSKAPHWLSNDITVDGAGRTRTDAFHSFGLTVENRFYIGSNAPQGFYLAPYARYNRIWLRIRPITLKARRNKNRGRFRRRLGFGAAAGLQFRLGDNMTIDATFAGIDLKWMRGSMTYSSTDPNNDITEFRDKVQDAVEHIPSSAPSSPPTSMATR